MRRHAAILLPLIAFGCGPPESPAPPSKGLVIESSDLDRPYFHDFGLILDGASPKHTFRFHNTEPNPVTVHDVLASCSCIVPVIRVTSPSGEVTSGSVRSKDTVCVIPPSGFMDVEVALDTSRIRLKNTDRLTTVRLRTNSLVTPFHTLELHVKVHQLIQATPWEIDLGEVAFSEGGTGHTVVIVAVEDQDVNLRTAISLSPELTVTHHPEVRLGRSLWVVNASIEPGIPIGPWKGSLQLIVDAPAQDPPERTVVIPVRAQIVSDIVLRPRRVFLLRDNRRGAEFTAEALVPGTRFTIVSATLSGFPQGAFTTSATPIRPDVQGRASTWKIRVTPTGPRPTVDLNGKLRATLKDGTILEAVLLAR